MLSSLNCDGIKCGPIHAYWKSWNDKIVFPICGYKCLWFFKNLHKFDCPRAQLANKHHMVGFKFEGLSALSGTSIIVVFFSFTHSFQTCFNYRLLIILGVVLLVSSSWLVRLLPRRLRRFVRSGVDRNFGVRQSGSIRIREATPSTVIQAATLHHLMASPSKEKAWRWRFSFLASPIVIGNPGCTEHSAY